MKQKEFVTADLYLTAAISLLINTNPSFRLEKGRVLFAFPLSDRLYEAMASYNNGELISAIDFAQMIKRIRAEMLMRRDMGERE